MTVYGGNYKEWINFQPPHIDNCSLWLDGKDNSVIAESNGIYGWIDKSTTTYTPDTATPNPTGSLPAYSTNATRENNYIIAGESGWTKVTNTTGSGYHQATILNAFPNRNRIKVSFTYYIPIGSEIDGMYWCGGNNQSIYGFSPSFEQGAIKRITNIQDIRLNLVGSNMDDFVIGVNVGGSASYVGDTSQIWYVKDYYEEVWDGNTFWQGTTANRPTYDSSIGSINFNKSSNQNLILNNINNLISAEGELFTVTSRASVSDQSTISIVETVETNQYFAITPHHANDRILTGGVADDINGNNIINSTINKNDTDWIITSFSSDGSIWFGSYNNNKVNFEIVSGSNTGEWTNHNSNYDKMGISCIPRDAAVYYSSSFKEIIMYNRRLNSKERRAVFHYLNTKYCIY